MVDHQLAQRLERVEAHANAAFVESRAAIAPEVGAAWIDVEGTWAMFDGPTSPLTQSFGLGLFTEPSPQQLDQLESFFSERNAVASHEVSLIADPAILSVLAARGYVVTEWSSVLARPMTTHTTTDSSVSVRVITADDADAWAEVSAQGWSEQPELVDFLRGLGQVTANAAGTASFLAEIEGKPVATGSLHVHDGVALFTGASTIPSARNRGAQQALLQSRLAFARQQGCELAMMVAQPGSPSHRNAQRAGFTPVYGRIKFARP